MPLQLVNCTTTTFSQIPYNNNISVMHSQPLKITLISITCNHFIVHWKILMAAPAEAPL